MCLQEVTRRIYHLFQQSPWWHRYTVSQQQPQPYYTLLLYRKDIFKPSGPFHLYPFPNSVMGTYTAHCIRIVEGVSIWVSLVSQIGGYTLSCVTVLKPAC